MDRSDEVINTGLSTFRSSELFIIPPLLDFELGFGLLAMVLPRF